VASECQVLINALTGHVGPSTKMSGYPTYQELARRNFPEADFWKVTEISLAG
jgi:hypothetical protein